MLVATVVLVRLYWSPCRDNGPGGTRLVLRRFRLASGCSRTSETMILQCAAASLAVKGSLDSNLRPFKPIETRWMNLRDSPVIRSL